MSNDTFKPRSNTDDVHRDMHSNHPHESHDSSHLRQYIIGFLLSLALTLISFGVVMMPHTGLLSSTGGLTAIVVLCVVELIVQLVYFLHLGTADSKRTNTAIFLCTGTLIAIIVGLSLWVMHNANVNMMPTHLTIERAISRD